MSDDEGKTSKVKGQDTEPIENFVPLVTEDGSKTLVHPVFGEAYSSKHGAWMQARELYLKQTQTHLHPQPKVLEVGFGLGVNFRTTLSDCLGRGVRLEYLSYELFSVSLEILQSVEVAISPEAQAIWELLLTQWPPKSNLVFEGNWGHLEVRLEDVTQAEFPKVWATAVYFDPFSPDVNAEPWQPEVLQKVRAACHEGSLLATYSVQGQFRRDLLEAGFEVKKVPGVGKRHWTLARAI